MSYEDAKWWLIDYLTECGGSAGAKDGLAAAEAAGFASSTVSEGRKRAGVTSLRSGFGPGAGFVWTLDLSRDFGVRPVEVAYSMACERPTATFPDGRTGTRNGYESHRYVGEKPCQACTDAHSAHTLARRRALPPDELERYRRRNAEATRRRTARNPGKRKAELLKFRVVNREILRAAKDVPCTDCDVTYPYYVTQFDHVRGEKEFNVGNFGPTCSREKLLAEIAKCDVVCANCHAERTHQRSAAGGAGVA